MATKPGRKLTEEELNTPDLDEGELDVETYPVPPGPKDGPLADAWREAKRIIEEEPDATDPPPDTLHLYAYTDDGEQHIGIVSRDDWLAFAEATEQHGGELMRLTHAGHTDETLARYAVKALREQLAKAEWPERCQAVADMVRGAAESSPEVVGLAVAVKGPEEIDDETA